MNVLLLPLLVIAWTAALLFLGSPTAGADPWTVDASSELMGLAFYCFWIWQIGTSALPDKVRRWLLMGLVFMAISASADWVDEIVEHTGPFATALEYMEAVFVLGLALMTRGLHLWLSEKDHRIREHSAHAAQMRHERELDALTGLNNRWAYDHALTTALRVAEETGTALSLLVVDADAFKRFNDAHGHHKGDLALTALGSALREGRRSGDGAFRLGGEEFVLLLPGTEKEGALLVAERIRARIESAVITDNAGWSASLTVSIGGSGFQPGDTATSLFERADAALYVSKSQGRNRVTWG